jgi:hypothetical protein
MCGKVIDKCNKIAEKEVIKQHYKYKKESKELDSQSLLTFHLTEYQ